MKFSPTTRATASALGGIFNTTAMGWAAGWLFEQSTLVHGFANYTAICILMGFAVLLVFLSAIATIMGPVVIMMLASMKGEPL